MQKTNENIVYSHPCIKWEIKSIINAAEFNLTERLKAEPNIIDSLDYCENISYINEVSLELNNEDGYLSNTDKTGLFDNEDDEIEIIIKGKLDGTEQLYTKFGGYIDSDRIRNIEEKKSITIIAYSYFGKAERIIGDHLVTRYIENHGLFCYNLGIHISHSNIQGKELLPGTHQINSQLDGSNKQLQLDDGEWVTLSAGNYSTLYNSKQDQAVEVYYQTAFYESKTQIIISKNKTDQYPYVYYLNPNIFELLEKCFQIMSLENYSINAYELQTWDERKFLSNYEQLLWLLLKPTIIISDFDKKLYVGNGNKVLMRNMVTQQWSTIFEDTQHSTLDCINLILDPGGYLFVYLGATAGMPLTMYLWKVDLNNNNNKTILLANEFSNPNGRMLLGNGFNSLVYSQTLGMFVFKWQSLTMPITYHISTLDLSGNVVDIYTNPNIIADGFNIIREESNYVKYYFLQTVPGNIMLEEMTYNFGSQQFSAPVAKINWRQSQASDNRYVIGTIFRAENKMFARELNQSGEPFFYDFTNNDYIGTEVFNPDNHKLLAPYEWNSRLYLVAYDNNYQKLAYIKNNAITYLDNLAGLGIFDFNNDTDLKKMCITVNEYNSDVFNFIDRNDNYLKRLSSWFIPYLNGELNCGGKTLRNLIDIISNSYLGYFKISPDKIGYFTKREYYNSNNVLEVKKVYIKSRVTEKAYNEKYDRVKVSNKIASEYYGSEEFDSKEKSISNEYLPTSILKDTAKFLFDYYSIKRKLIKISYIPEALSHNTQDVVDLSDVSLNNGVLHKITPKKAGVNLEVLIES